jgi:hypothetical protein
LSPTGMPVTVVMVFGSSINVLLIQFMPNPECSSRL